MEMAAARKEARSKSRPLEAPFSRAVDRAFEFDDQDAHGPTSAGVSAHRV